MKLLKKLLAVLLLIILVIGLFIAGLIFFVDPNKLKPVIAQEVKKRTGYDVTLDGNLQWTLYPLLGISLEHAKLAKPNQPSVLDLQKIKFSTELLPLLRRDVNLSGHLYADKITLVNIQFDHAHVKINWQNQTLILDPFSASAYNGVMTGNAAIDHFKATPHVEWKLKIKNVDLAALLHDLSPNTKLNIRGLGNLTFDASSEGFKSKEFLTNLNGKMDLQVESGALQGIDLNYLFQTADALINRQPINADPNLDQTPFNEFSGSAVINDGIVKTDDLHLTANAFSVSSVGKINLVQQTLDLKLILKPATSAKTQWMVPVIINGDFSRPNKYLDISALQKYLVQQQTDNIKEKVVDEVGKKVSGKAGELLQNMLGR